MSKKYVSAKSQAQTLEYLMEQELLDEEKPEICNEGVTRKVILKLKTLMFKHIVKVQR